METNHLNNKQLAVLIDIQQTTIRNLEAKIRILEIQLKYHN